MFLLLVITDEVGLLQLLEVMDDVGLLQLPEVWLDAVGLFCTMPSTKKDGDLANCCKKTLNEEEEEEKMPQPPQIKFPSYFSNELPWPRGGSDRNPQQPAKEKKSSCQDRFCNYFSEQFDAESGVS